MDHFRWLLMDNSVVTRECTECDHFYFQISHRAKRYALVKALSYWTDLCNEKPSVCGIIGPAGLKGT